MFAVDIMMVSGNCPLKVTVTHGLGLASTFCSKESGMRSHMFSDVHCFLAGRTQEFMQLSQTDS